MTYTHDQLAAVQAAGEKRCALLWQRDQRTVVFDHTVVFGHGYDYFPLEYLWQEAAGKRAKYLIWGRGDKWSLYRDSDGMMSFENLTEQSAKDLAAQWEEKP